MELDSFSLKHTQLLLLVLLFEAQILHQNMGEHTCDAPLTTSHLNTKAVVNFRFFHITEQILVIRPLYLLLHTLFSLILNYMRLETSFIYFTLLMKVGMF